MYSDDELNSRLERLISCRPLGMGGLATPLRSIVILTLLTTIFLGDEASGQIRNRESLRERIRAAISLNQPDRETNQDSNTELDSESADNNSNNTPKAGITVRVLRDEVYQATEGRSGRCDVFLPAKQPVGEKLPVVILVHGGGWIGGDKWNLKGYAHQLAENGFAAISINYRHAPKHQFPKQVDDVRQAMLWTTQQQDRFQLDLNRVGMFGYSAGGHLTALVACLANESLDTQSKASGWSEKDVRWQQLPTIKAICIGGPPCNFESLPPNNTSMAFFLGDSRNNAPDTYRAASPLAHVSAGDPPTCIIHGETDIMVPLKSSQRFHQAQTAAGVESELIVLPKQGHMLAFLNPKTASEMIRHFQKQLQ